MSEAGRWEGHFFLSPRFPVFYFSLSNKSVVTQLDLPNKSGNAISKKPETYGWENAQSYRFSVQHIKK